MDYYSTNDPGHIGGFRTAVLRGIAGDGGLFMPAEIPVLPAGFIGNLPDLTLPEIGFKVISGFAGGIPEGELRRIIERAFTFDAPLVRLDETLSILELFHGPTLAFKDFGARFLAQCLAFFNKDENKELLILVATSGDTGSAVAHSFHGAEGVRVGLLYPAGMVSRIQEQQLTTMGGNVRAFEVGGTFDDCQRLVKTAFADAELRSRCNLSSANSINIARLLPQSVYYYYAWGQLKKLSGEERPLFAVPSGNFGNLTAGVFASGAGLPVKRFIAALNANTVFWDYLERGSYRPRPAVKTLSNAMDVGDPSNFARLDAYFGHDVRAVRRSISCAWASDAETLAAMRGVYRRYGYILDPHGGVGCRALEEYRRRTGDKTPAIVLETAHPAKFGDIVEEALGLEVEVPERLAASLKKEKQATAVSGRYEDFKEALMDE